MVPSRRSRVALAVLAVATTTALAVLSACYTAVDDDAASAKRSDTGSSTFVPAEAPPMPPIPPGAGPPAPRPAPTTPPADSGGGGTDAGQDTGAPEDAGAG